MLIDDMSLELFGAIQDIWQENEQRLPDNMRDPQIVESLLLKDNKATQWYMIADTAALLVVGDINPELNASVLLLNHEFAEIGEILHEMREVITALDLKRLTASVPGPVKDVQRALEQVGFRREGHLRRSMVWNGRLVGTDIYGLYRDPARESRREVNHDARQEATKEVRA